MQYGTQKSTGPFVISITVRHEPRCPGCAEFLQPAVVVFFEGWAWCPVCLSMGLHSQPWIGVVLGDERMLEHSALVNGLRFYTPDVVGGEAKTAYETAVERMQEIPIRVLPYSGEDEFQMTTAGAATLGESTQRPRPRLESDMWADGTLPAGDLH